MTVDPGNIAPAMQGVTPDNVSLLDQLRTIVGRRHVLTGEAGTRVTGPASTSAADRRWRWCGQAPSSSNGKC